MLRPGRRLSFAGAQAQAALRLAANVASTETVTVGAEVYEVNIVNTSMAKTTSCNNTDSPVSLTITAHGFVAGNVGDLIRIDSEIFKILSITSEDVIVCSRAHSGTTIATHTTATVYKAGTPATAGRNEVGLVTTLTPAAFSAAFVAVFNAENALGMTAEATATYEIIFRTVTRKADTTAISEGLAGASNVVLDAAMQAGALPADGKEFTYISHVPTAADVTLGYFHIAVPFTPVAALIFVAATSGGAVKKWDGALTMDATNKRLKLDNAGSVDWAATDTVTALVWS